MKKDPPMSAQNLQETALLKKDLELQKVMAKNSGMEKENLMKQIMDIKVQHENERDLLT